MSSEVGGVDRHDDLVALARWDLVVAPGAPVGLDCLVGLDVANFHRIVVAQEHAGSISAR